MERRLDRAATSTLPRHRRRQRFVAGIVLGALATGSAVLLAGSQRQERDDIHARWDARTDLASGFVTTYVEQLFQRESDVAAQSLAADPAAFPGIVAAFGFSNAVLLDEQGTLLAVHPAKPELLGTRIAGKYPHLSTAVTGVRAVSPVVPAASDGQPVVGFAMPYSTPHGLRVFSGAYSVRSTPLAAYLERTTTLKGSRLYLVDSSGTVVTSSMPTKGVQRLVDVDPDLAEAAQSRRHGVFGSRYFASDPVEGTPWRVVASTEQSALLHSVSGPGHYAPWVLLGLLTAVAAFACWLLFRRFDDHAQLRLSYQRLDRVARTDALTGVLNRGSARERLELEHDRVRHQAGWLSVLMVDVDHFKRINDTFGHAAGDIALVTVADRLREDLREHDVIGRWGGEEFLIVLPFTDSRAASEVAERVRRAVSGASVALGSGGDAISMSVSVGVASSLDAVPDVLVAAADRALYAAKGAGRDRVHAFSP